MIAVSHPKEPLSRPRARPRAKTSVISAPPKKGSTNESENKFQKMEEVKHFGKFRVAFDSQSSYCTYGVADPQIGTLYTPPSETGREQGKRTNPTSSLYSLHVPLWHSPNRV